MAYKGSTITGNYYNKHATKNPIERFLVKYYEKAFKNFIINLEVSTAYEVGSGEGVLLKWISEVRPDIKTFGSDIQPIFDMSLFTNRISKPIFLINRAENIPFSPDTLDLIVVCEVLEHLENPSACLSELQRLNAKKYLLSVPNANLWRMLNILRLKYVKKLGNTPGHLNNWTNKSFIRLVSGYLDIQDVILSHPWIFVLAS
jgi:ubiquinone/menaquinone biosynthesis C-methylase UbiE